MRSLAPLAILAGRTLCLHPSSRIARENLEVFCDTWSQSVNDLSRLAKESDAAANGRVAAEKQAYMSLPRPGVSSNSSGLSFSVPLLLQYPHHAPLQPFKRSFESQTVSQIICDSDDSSSSVSTETSAVLPTRTNAVLVQGGDELSSAASATSEDRKAFEYRISLIIDDLQNANLHDRVV